MSDNLTPRKAYEKVIAWAVHYRDSLKHVLAQGVNVTAADKKSLKTNIQAISDDVEKANAFIAATPPNGHATVTWHQEDIATLRPSWTPEQCEEWLEDNSRRIQDRIVELGWGVIETLIGEDDE
jgi:hypothetical protein